MGHLMQGMTKWSHVWHKRSQKSINRDMGPTSFVCFYCRGQLQEGTGRRFRLVVDGPVWECHRKHPVHPNEILVEERPCSDGS